MSTSGTGKTIKFRPWLTEDAPRPPDNKRTIEPPERISLLVEAIRTLEQENKRLQMKVGVLCSLVTEYMQHMRESSREFSYIEFKAVVRCMAQDLQQPYGCLAVRCIYGRGGKMLEGDVVDEEEIVKQIREGMEEVSGAEAFQMSTLKK